MRYLLSSILVCILAITVYNSDSMLARIAQFSKHIRPVASNTAKTNSMTMSTTSPSATSTFKGLPVIPPNDPLTTTSPRKIEKSFLAIEQGEGAGARVRRSIGTPKLRNFSPFLMLDHFSIAPGAGFPDHPHRYVHSHFPYKEKY